MQLVGSVEIVYSLRIKEYRYFLERLPLFITVSPIIYLVSLFAIFSVLFI